MFGRRKRKPEIFPDSVMPTTWIRMVATIAGIKDIEGWWAEVRDLPINDPESAEISRKYQQMP